MNKELLSIYLKENQKTYKELMVDMLKQLKISIKEPDKFINLFIPSTCVLMSNKFNKLPFSCYLLDCDDSMYGIMKAATLTAVLSSLGGGIGLNLSNIREVGCPVSSKYGKASGVIAAAKIFEPTIQFCTKSENRGGAVCCYLDVDHPEIEDFIRIREITGTTEKRARHIHHGVNLSDEFMKAVVNREQFNLISRFDGSVVKTINARELFLEIARIRLENGEPFIVFSDTVNKAMAEIGYIEGADKVTISNLCTEVLVRTRTNGKAHIGVCCLGSLNLLELPNNYYDGVEKDICSFFTAMYDFAGKELKKIKSKDKELYDLLNEQLSIAMEDRTFGLGVFNYALAVEKYESEELILSILKKLYENLKVATKGKHKLCGAIAPTSRLSLLFDGTPCLEHFKNSNYKHLDGNFTYDLGLGSTNKIIPYQDDVANTEYMLRCKALLECGIDQSISCNLQYDPSVQGCVKECAKDMIYAWELGLRTLYYARAKSVGSTVEACAFCSN